MIMIFGITSRQLLKTTASCSHADSWCSSQKMVVAGLTFATCKLDMPVAGSIAAWQTLLTKQPACKLLANAFPGILITRWRENLWVASDSSSITHAGSMLIVNTACIDICQVLTCLFFTYIGHTETLCFKCYGKLLVAHYSAKRQRCSRHKAAPQVT